jgi:hypothetical protein
MKTNPNNLRPWRKIQSLLSKVNSKPQLIISVILSVLGVLRMNIYDEYQPNTKRNHAND